MHVLHNESQGLQTLVSDLYSFVLHVKQEVEVDEHVTQFESQAVHSLVELSAYLPSGQRLTHSYKLKTRGGSQDVQVADVPSKQVLHDESQGRHLEPYKYLPGIQSVQSFKVEPEHFMHEESHF